MQFFCNRAAAASMSSPPSAAARQMQLSYVGQMFAVDLLQSLFFAAIIDVDERCVCNVRRRAPPQSPVSLAHREQSSRTDHARRHSGPSDVCTSMNWGVRIALLTSDHFAAPGQEKLRFSAAPSLDPSHERREGCSAPCGPGCRFAVKSLHTS